MSKLAERYARAARSSHLKVEPEQGDVDVIAVAGWAGRRKPKNGGEGDEGAGLGTLLMRCRKEWDEQRALIEQTEEVLRAIEAQKIAQAKLEGRLPITVVIDMRQQVISSRALILINMPSIRPAADALGRHAANRARQRGLALQPEVIRRASGNALDIWLDQRCNTCAGTKETGIYGGPRAICNKCKGTGIRRRVLPSKSSEELALGEWLMAEADRLVAAAQRKMSQALR